MVADARHHRQHGVVSHFFTLPNRDVVAAGSSGGLFRFDGTGFVNACAAL
jgi:hypothetical protein